MIKKSVNNLSIVGFLILLILLLVTAIGLFLAHYGFSVNNLYIQYAGDEAQFINPKTFIGILKSFSPHILAMPVIFFVLFHIGTTSQTFKKESIKYIAMFGFGSTLGDIFINFFISYGIFFAYMKVFFLVAFELTLLYMMWLFLQKIYKL